jgi:hypothetical protein
VSQQPLTTDKFPSFYIKYTIHSALTNFAPIDLFLVFHSKMTTAVSPEVILLHDPGTCVPFYIFSIYSTGQCMNGFRSCSDPQKICEDRLKL